MKLACAAALSLAAAACGQGDTGNVMAASGNALSPEQVDAALGPEVGNIANQVEPDNGLNAVQDAPATESAEAGDRRPDRESRASPEPEPEPEPERDETAAGAAPANNTTD